MYNDENAEISIDKGFFEVLENDRKCWKTRNYALITRRSKVQVLPPQLQKIQCLCGLYASTLDFLFCLKYRNGAHLVHISLIFLFLTRSRPLPRSSEHDPYILPGHHIRQRLIDRLRTQKKYIAHIWSNKSKLFRLHLFCAEATRSILNQKTKDQEIKYRLQIVTSSRMQSPGCEHDTQQRKNTTTRLYKNTENAYSMVLWNKKRSK